jgi:hypothetical protein
MAYCFADDNGKPVLFRAFSDWKAITLLELFRTDQAAWSFAQELCKEGEDPADEGFMIDKISGTSILDAISSADQITIDSETFAISNDGVYFDSEEVLRPEPEELRQLLMGSTDSI